MSNDGILYNKTFENFIVSSSNKKAYDVCRKLVEDLGSHYIVLYGPTSCGKTHLLFAVRNEYLKKYPESKLLMTSYNDIILEYTTALLEDKRDEFRRAIYGFDLIIIDNMQFIVGKTEIQKEFSDLFSKMLTAGKSIIIAFDRPIQYFKKFISNGRNDFPEKCSVIKLGYPDISLRVKYLNQMIEKHCIELPQNVKDYIISSNSISFASLQGCLLKLQLIQKLNGTEITIDDIKKYLSNYN